MATQGGTSEAVARPLVGEVGTAAPPVGAAPTVARAAPLD